MNEDDGYVLREEPRLVRVKIPEGMVKCPDCHGSGKMRICFDSPHDFAECITCQGRGFVEKEWLEHLKRWKKGGKEHE